MSVSLAALAPLTSKIGAISNLLLVSPQNRGIQAQPSFFGETQPPTFLFNYEGEQTFTMRSDITDHYIEDNTAIQDQIALRPTTITTHGFIGEINDIAPELLTPLKAIADKLTIISGFTPRLSTTALIAYNEAFFLYQIASAALNTADSLISGALFGSYPQNNQQIAFQKFLGWWQDRILFTVETPWGVFQNQAIESCRAIQSEETRVITDFEITFKQINFASTNAGIIIQQGRLRDQAAPTVQHGSVGLTPASETFSSHLSTVGSGIA